jgi:hypothetical protein
LAWLAWSARAARLARAFGQLAGGLQFGIGLLVQGDFRTSRPVWRLDSSCATRRLLWASTSHQATMPAISSRPR